LAEAAWIIHRSEEGEVIDKNDEQAIETACKDEVFQSACQSYARANGSSLRIMRAAARALRKAGFAGIEPDMFWRADDPERALDNPGDAFAEDNIWGVPIEFMRAIERTNAWGVAIPTKRDEDDPDEVEDFDLHWFATEAEAEAFCETQKRGDGLPLIEATSGSAT
jgi:hypothetical protein